MDTNTVGLLTTCLLLFCLHFASGGNCWSSISKSGRCTALLKVEVGRADCCQGGGLSTAWSEEDLAPGRLFFWRALGGGVPCQPCRDSCEGVICDPDKTCVLRGGVPKCVCNPHCKKHQKKGEVCGSDGKTYRSPCRLMKKACRRTHPLTIAYYGKCQIGSCERVKCRGKQECLLDQNLQPHCVRCKSSCPVGVEPKPVCGVDGRTHRTACELRKSACQKGKAIPVAYKGHCQANATCSSVRCRRNQRCLTDQSGAPRCTTCRHPCRHLRGSDRTVICATNNRTYRSWCHMMKAACRIGKVLETLHPGQCSTTVHKSLPCNKDAVNGVLSRDIVATQ